MTDRMSSRYEPNPQESLQIVIKEEGRYELHMEITHPALVEEYSDNLDEARLWIHRGAEKAFGSLLLPPDIRRKIAQMDTEYLIKTRDLIKKWIKKK